MGACVRTQHAEAPLLQERREAWRHGLVAAFASADAHADDSTRLHRALDGDTVILTEKEPWRDVRKRALQM